MTTITRATAESYARGTASMQTDTEAHRLTGAASASSPATAFPLDQARCATTTEDLEWVPDHERSEVPPQMATLCRRCPGRQNCLLWALAGEESGYWAGTTTADRAVMLARGLDRVVDADRLQSKVIAANRAGAQHAPGEGSYFHYRHRKCRCAECREANAAVRAEERSRARARLAAAA